MRQCTLLLLILIFSGLASAQTVEPVKGGTEITVCPVRLLAVTANFRFGYRYLIKTDSKGFVAEVKQISTNHPGFIKDEEFIPCIKGWKLKPSDDYFIGFYLGTNSGKNHILISSKTESIKINIGPIVHGR